MKGYPFLLFIILHFHVGLNYKLAKIFMFD